MCSYGGLNGQCTLQPARWCPPSRTITLWLDWAPLTWERENPLPLLWCWALISVLHWAGRSVFRNFKGKTGKSQQVSKNTETPGWAGPRDSPGPQPCASARPPSRSSTGPPSRSRLASCSVCPGMCPGGLLFDLGGGLQSSFSELSGKEPVYPGKEWLLEAVD